MQTYNIIGVMSGTSLDGLDIVLCNFTYKDKWNFKILKYKTIEYSEYWKSKLTNAPDLNGYELTVLDKKYGQYIGDCILKFLLDTDIKINLIASHGHTVFHRPENGITLQIGDGSQICSVTNTTTISDFRTFDVAMGGQGAPLAPIGDKLLFPEYQYCLNIGGFANISFEQKKLRFAYDICPANIILNILANELGFAYDKNGALGKTGKINTNLLSKLNDISYYEDSYPKSLGREWLENTFMPIISSSNSPIVDQLATVYEHISSQIAESIISNPNTKVLITGGGVYNNFLIDLFRSKTNAKIIIPKKEIIEYKEAVIFAFLGILRLNKQVNCLSSATGARGDTSSGIIHIPNS